MRILVIGKTGFIGGRITAHLREAGHSIVGTHRPDRPDGLDGPDRLDRPRNAAVASTHNNVGDSLAFDLLDPLRLREILPKAGIQVVIHAAAMAGVGHCERDPAAALQANSTATAAIANVCSEAQTRLISLSTDQVFAGGPPAAGGAVPIGGYREHDATGPVNLYGLTKQQAEVAILNMNASGITIVRLALVVGRSLQGGRSSSEQLIAQVARGETPTLYQNEFRTPICVADVCSAIEELLPMGDVKLLHLGGPERMSRVELGQRILRLAGLNDTCNAVDASEPSPGEAKRPRDVALNSSLAREILKHPPRRLEQWANECIP